jgi:hypothetical protein
MGAGVHTGKRVGRIPMIAGSLIVTAALGMVMGASTRAAFSDSIDNTTNGFTAGSVAVGDNDAGDLMMALTDATPGASSTACITVTYSGTLPSSVRLYGSTIGTGLASYLTLKVTRGTFTSSPQTFASCTNFSADTTDYIGQGTGVVYNGTLQSFPGTYASGLVDPLSSAPEQWTTDEAHAYKFTVTLQDDAAAEGKTANTTFSWEARND